MRYCLLVIDDDRIFTASVKHRLKRFDVVTANSITEGKRLVDSTIDLVLLDLVFDEKTPDHTEGLDYLPEIVKNFPGLPVVIMTNFPSYEKSVTAIKIGAKDFLLKKTLDWDEWENRILNYCHDYREIQTLKEKTDELEKKFGDSEIVGNSPEILYVKRKLKDLAINSPDATILISGATGTGKNLAVKYFRNYSVRKNKPFKETSLIELTGSILSSELFGHVKGAFTDAKTDKKGLFEDADGGILFLDEIGDYDLSVQKKILRFLEDKTITPVGGTKSKRLDVQLIMATNKDLELLIREGRFREDLFYRINRVRVVLPPLKERDEDIPTITEYLFNHIRIKEHTALRRIHPDVFRIFFKYPWRGNVRELQSVIFDACSNARLENDTELEVKHLKKEVREYTPDNQANPIEMGETDFVSSDNEDNEPEIKDIQIKKIELELQAIDDALGKTYGQKAEAAKLLSMTADQMRYRVIKLVKTPEIMQRYRNIVRHYRIKVGRV